MINLSINYVKILIYVLKFFQKVFFISLQILLDLLFSK